MRFQDYSVRTKISAVMVGILVVAIASGIFSILQLAYLNANSAALRDNWLPATRALGELRYEMTRFRAMTGMYMLCATDEERATQEKRLAAKEQDIAVALKKFEGMMDTGEERILAGKIRDTWAAYLPMHHNLLETRKTKGHEAAAYYLRIPMRKPFDALNAALDAAIAYENSGGTAAGDRSQSTYASARIWSLLAILLLVGWCLGAAMVLVRAVSVPLNRITGAMDELARGHLEANVPHADQQDEIGRLAGSMQSFKEQLAAAEKAKAEQTQVIVSSIGTGLDCLAKGDLTHRVSAELTGPFAKLKSDFNAAMVRLEDTLRNVLFSSGQITSGAGEISQAADDLSRRTEQQAASLEETAAALEEITATVKATATNARQANAGVASTKAAAEQGGRVVQTAIEAMDAIAGSSKKITDIIGVIDEIAFQTNLLALNAGVEAARAGEAGRGFAVVASEVRALAQRSGEAAKQIKALINASGQQVGQGVKLVGETGTALREIVAQVQKINALVSEMAQAAEQQSTGIEQVNAAVSQMDQVTQQNAAMVEESTAASKNLATETQALQELIAFFQVGGASASRVSGEAAALPSRPVRSARSYRQGTAALAAQKEPAAKADDWTEF